MDKKNWDVFISHASEDKDSIVRELAEFLSRVGVRVWYDEFTLEVGDSLTRKIDEGLIYSNFGVVIISEAFLKKRWTDYEYRSLLTKDDKGKKIILPVWHGVNRDDIIEFSLYLADKVALDTSNISVNEVASKILAVVRPDIYKNLCRILLMKKKLREATTEHVERSQLTWGEKQRNSLSEQQINRIKGYCFSIGLYLDSDFKQAVECLLYDHLPEREIQVWEAMNVAFNEFILHENISDQILKKEIANHLLMFSIGMIPEQSILSEEQLLNLSTFWAKSVKGLG